MNKGKKVKKIFLSILGLSISLLAYNGGTFTGNIKGCAEGNAKACNDLAGMYFGGRYLGEDSDPVRVPDDKEKAISYYAKSIELYSKYCDKGGGKACFDLAEKYNGMRWGIDQNYTMMLKYHTRSCDNGYARGCNEVGSFYKRGKGTKKDKVKSTEYYKKSIELYEKECNEKIARSCSNLSAIYQFKMYDTDNRPRGVELEKRAFQLNKELCEQKDDEGCFQTATSYHGGGVVPIDWKKAKAYFGLSCEYGQSSACWRGRDINISKQFEYEKKRELGSLSIEYGMKEQRESDKWYARTEKQQKRLNDNNKTMPEKKELLKIIQAEDALWKKESAKRIKAIKQTYKEKKEAIEARIN